MVTAIYNPIYRCPVCMYHHRVYIDVPILCCRIVVYPQDIPTMKKEAFDDDYFSHPSRLGLHGPHPEPVDSGPVSQPADPEPAPSDEQPPPDDPDPAPAVS